MNLASWLRDLGLERYLQALEDNDVDASTLRLLTETDLAEMGIKSVGHRRKLMTAIATLGEKPPDGDGSTPPPPVPAPPPQAEHRQISVACCDMVGSTALSTRLDPEDYKEVIRAFHSRCMRAVAEYDGWVANFVGDSIVAYFGWPRAHEDDPERAVRSGLAVVQAIKGTDTEVRVGIATGSVLVGELIDGPGKEQSALGTPPELAERLQAVAEPGQVVVDETTRRLVRNFAMRVLRPQGAAGQVVAHVVGAELSYDSRFDARAQDLAPIIGREHELELLHKCWAQAQGGEGLVVLLTGEAGIGKSRLARALLDARPAHPHLVVHWQCSPYHTGSALWPVIQRLTRSADLQGEDSTDVALDKLEALVGNGEPSALYAVLLGLDGAQRYGPMAMSPGALRERTLEVMAEQLFEIAADRPLLLLVEDAHWIDPTTLELLQRCQDNIAQARMLILVTSRPDPSPHLGPHANLMHLFLSRLSRASVQAMLERLSGQMLQEQTRTAIMEQSDGVPLFVEELTKAALEMGEAAIPASLHGSLMGRLDLIPQAKEVAQAAACIGREFDLPLLQELVERRHAVGEALDRLVKADLVLRHGRTNERYAFKHALVQEAASESLPRRKRREVHSRIFDLLSRRVPPGAPEVRARHAERAARHDEALGCWEEAARRSTAQSAYKEAAGYFRHAIDLLKREGLDSPDHDRELRLLCEMGESQMAAQGYGAAEVMLTFERAHALLADGHDLRLRTQITSGLWVGKFAWGHTDVALALARGLMRAAGGTPDAVTELAAMRMRGATEFDMGKLDEAQVHLERAAELHESQRDQRTGHEVGVDPGIAARGFLARTAFLLGDHARAQRVMQQALAAAARGSPHTQANARHHSALLQLMARKPGQAEGEARQMLALARQHRLRLWEGQAMGDLGCALMQQGAHAEAVDELERALAQLGGASIMTPYFRMALAQALTGCGRAAEGWDGIERLMSDFGPHRWAEAEAWRVHGEIGLARGAAGHARAEQSFARALAVARAQKAIAWELSITLSIARHRQAQGRDHEAALALMPLLDTLRGTFDTVDLRDAQLLLAQHVEGP